MSAFVVAIAISAASIGQTSSVTYVSTLTQGLEYPARLASVPLGGIYVTDPTTKQVVQYDSGGVFVATFTVSQVPWGVAAHPDGRVFVSRGDGAIGVYSPVFAVLGTVDPAPLTMTAPNDLAYDAVNNELYAVDSGANRVLVFTESAPATWTLARSWGMGGTALGLFTTPQAIAVNPALGRVMVTDSDNYRVQVFDRNGLLLFKFGYRMLFLPTLDLAWFSRVSGVTLDSCDNIYLSDALMGTVRVFSSSGVELGTTHTPLISYGTAAGQLRAPCDLTIDGSGNLYVASTNNGAVTVYSVACASPLYAPPIADDEAALVASRKERLGTDGRAPAPAPAAPQLPDNPSDLAAAVVRGDYCAEWDLNLDGQLDWTDFDYAVAAFGAGTSEDFLHKALTSGPTAHPALDAPHILNLPNRCGRCHSMVGAPGGMLTASGQENLCQSCHSAGKIAGDLWIGPGSDQNSHPWGIAADAGISDGPPPGSDLALHLDNGDIRCGTCHDPHNSADEMNYVRRKLYDTITVDISGVPGLQKPMTVMNSALCAECHTDIAAEWSIIGHADSMADPWIHYDWSMGNNWLCTGPGTPYAYCTGIGAGTTSSPATAFCTGPGTPLACCTGSGTGTCTITNASCTGLQTPWQCCLGAGTGNCIANSSCTGFQTPSLCCTGVGTGTCSNSLPAAMCTGVGTPDGCCTGVGAGSCSSRESCRQCHTGTGFKDYSQDYPDGVVATSTHSGSLRAVDCLVCHATHGESQNGKLLRIYDTVRLPTGQVFTGQEGGATCMACHNGRTIPATNPSSVSTPHYLNGAAMLEGVNAVTAFPGFGPSTACTGVGTPWSCCTAGGTGTCTSTVNAGCVASRVPWDCCTGLGTGTCANANCTGAGTPWACCTAGGTGPTCTAVQYTLSNSNHTTNAGLNCTTCHMGAGPTSGPGVGLVGGHTFRIKDHATGYENIGSTCNATGCHTGLTTINRTANGDYDGDATIEGVQDETRGLLDLLKDELYIAGASRLLLNAGVPTDESDPEGEPANPYWTLRRCVGGSRDALACNGTGGGTAPFNCPGGGVCTLTVPAGSRTATVINAIWNWEFVDNSEDLGVKNTGYAIGLLQIAYKGVTGVAVPGAAYRYSPPG